MSACTVVTAPTMSRAASARFVGPEVARDRQPQRHAYRYGLFETVRQFGEGRLAEAGLLEQTRDRHAAYFAGEAASRWEHWNGPGWRGRGRLGRGGARQPASATGGARPRAVEVATDIAADAALMGFSVPLFETLASAEELLETAAEADVRRLPASTRPPGTRASPGGRRRHVRRSPGDRTGGRLALRRVRTRLRAVHRGVGERLLRRPRSLR